MKKKKKSWQSEQNKREREIWREIEVSLKKL